MPGQFAPPPTLVSGQVYTADDHNTAWQTLYNNMTAAGNEGASSSLAQMRSQVNPGDVGTESLASTLLREIEHLRYEIAIMKATTYWYEPDIARVADLPVFCVDGSNVVQRPVLVDGSTRLLRARFRLPLARVPDTAMILYLWCTSTVATGTARLTYSIVRQRVGAASSALHGGDANLVDPTTNLILHQVVSVPDGGLVWTQGDLMDITVTRLGGDAGDTLAGDITAFQIGVQFTAYAGRP